MVAGALCLWAFGVIRISAVELEHVRNFCSLFMLRMFRGEICPKGCGRAVLIIFIDEIGGGEVEAGEHRRAEEP